jgi:hypothetical protein
MATSVLTGAVVGLLRADATLTALVAARSVHADQEPPEALLPLVVVTDSEDKPAWQNDKARKEIHNLTVTIRAVESSTPGGRNPAEAIADRVETLLDWTDPAVSGVLPNGMLKFERCPRVRTPEPRRGPNDEIVVKVVITWEVHFERNL